jgi:pyruvate formate lyase activating enzyme
MDIKTDPADYAPVFRDGGSADALLESLELVRAAAPDYEFRTTCVRPLIDSTVIGRISRHIDGAKRYVLQTFQNHNLLDPAFFSQVQPAFNPEEMAQLQAIAGRRVRQCLVR